MNQIRRRRFPVLFPVGLGFYFLLVLLMSLVEHGATDGNIDGFGDSLWYSIVTLTTVGYGDRFPVTPGGKVIAVAFLIGSLGVLGYLVGEINKVILERREHKRMGHDGTEYRNHVVIVGWNDFARSITRQLLGADREVAIITNRRDNVDLIYGTFPNRPVFVLFSELNNIGMFEKANLKESFVIFLNEGNDTDKLISILNLKKEYPDRNYLVTLDNPDLKETFQSAGVTYALSKNEIAAKLIASYIFEPDVAAFSNDLMSSTESAGEYDIQQYRVLRQNPFAGKTCGEAFWSLKKEHGTLLVAVAKQEGERRQLHKMPPDDLKIDVDDYLLVITDGVGEKVLVELFGTSEGIS